MSSDLLSWERKGFNFDKVYDADDAERENPQSCDHVTTLWGKDAGQSQQNNDIVLLSIYSLSNYYKNRILKIVCWGQHPLVGRSVVWHTSPKC